eukprot:GFUD01104339.1.p1 GENE.GFUD01104339.1~~GFUD01104339.1.p1  ORF type:complete len:364 (+),score=81.87 GFUD01104339.1:109-1200(+)
MQKMKPVGQMTCTSSSRDRLEMLLSRGRSLPHNLTTSDLSQDDKIDQFLMQEGISYFHANFLSMFVCMLTGLLSLMYVKSVSVILHITGKSSSPSLAFRRYLNTLRHTSMWYTGPGVDTMTRSLMEVRAKHRGAAKIAMSKGHLMSQYDMVLTQWAFIGPALIFPSSLGLPPPSPGVVYIMYLVGRYLGVSESLNLCSGGIANATDYSKMIHNHIIQPAIKNMDNDKNKVSLEMAGHLMKGMNMINPFIDPSAFHFWFLRLLSDGTPSSTKPMNIQSILLLKVQSFILGTVLHLPVVGNVMRHMANMLMRLNILLVSDWEELTIWFHQLADWPAWQKIVLVVLGIPVLSLGSGVRRLKTFCIN